MNVLGKISLFLSLACVLLTFALKLAFSGWMPYIGFGLGAGLFFFLFSMAINFRYIKSFLRSESLHFVLKSLLVSLLVCLALFFCNFIVAKQKLNFDITASKINSLPKLTQALINALPEDFTFYYFHVGNAKVRGFESTVRDSIQPYLQLSSKLHFQSHNVFKRPDLAKKFKIGDEESSLFAEYKGRITRVSSLDEAAVTNALLKLTKKAKKVYFIESNDERKVDDASTFGLKGLKAQLERLHYNVGVISEVREVPEDAAMLVMVGPRQKVPEDMILVLESYLQSGGALFVALDPGEDHQMAGFLKKYGVDFKNNFVFSTQAQAAQSELLVLTHKGRAKHEVANTLQSGQNPALFISSALEKIESPDGSLRVQSIFEHLPNAVTRKDIDPKSEVISEGEQHAGLISEGLKDSFFRLAVVGDSDFLTNQFYSRPGNFDLALGVFTFLSKDEDLLKLKIPVAQTTYMVLTQTQLNLYLIFFVLPVALLFFIIALFFKLRRFF